MTFINPNITGGAKIFTYDIRDGLTPENMRDLAVKSLDDDKAQDIQIIDLKGQSAIADYMIVASGTSSRQVIAMAEKLKERLHGRDIGEVRLEGTDLGNWVIVDAGDVIVHIFRPEVREFYNIEKMWNIPSIPASVTKDIHLIA